MANKRGSTLVETENLQNFWRPGQFILRPSPAPVENQNQIDLENTIVITHQYAGAGEKCIARMLLLHYICIACVFVEV